MAARSRATCPEGFGGSFLSFCYRSAELKFITQNAQISFVHLFFHLTILQDYHRRDSDLDIKKGSTISIEEIQRPRTTALSLSRAYKVC